MANLNTPDAELISLLKGDNEEALALIFKKYWKPLFSSAYNIFKDKEACEDIIQELFIKLWEKRNEIEVKVSLKSYLYASIKYEVYRQLKQSQIKESIGDDLTNSLEIPSVQGLLEQKELAAGIAYSIQSLPPKCKEVYILSRNEYLSHKEIAFRLNISTKTVENHLTKALRYLKVNIGPLLSMVTVVAVEQF